MDANQELKLREWEKAGGIGGGCEPRIEKGRGGDRGGCEPRVEDIV